MTFLFLVMKKIHKPFNLITVHYLNQMTTTECQINQELLNLRSGKKQIFELISLCRRTDNFGIGVLLGECFMDFFWSEGAFHIGLDELCICYYYSGQYENSWLTYEKLIQYGFIEPERMKQLMRNAVYNIPHIIGKLPSFRGQVIPNSCPMITLTITTCKRLDLFLRTVNSFLNCCLDHHLIHRWICIDDNSSDEDREVMRKTFPFFEFIWKGPDQKGHPISMNMLLDTINTPYVFHMEDDWEYYLHRPYIQHCLEGIQMGYAQCLVNPNYAEIPSDDIIGGEYQLSRNGVIVVEHTYEPDGTEFVKRFGHGSNCAYWPHYSLRPGITKVSVLREIGDYTCGIEHFELEYAKRYISHGYKTSFLYPSGCKHIGRLTSEKHTDVPNAYTLNDQIQFSNSERKSRTPTLIATVVVNMDRRPDRLEQMQPIMKQLGATRFRAVDGKELKMTRRMEQLFNPNDYNFRRGIIGCAMSHIQIWIELLSLTYPLLVLEDDVALSDNFTRVVSDILTRNDWDIVMIGYHPRVNGVEEMTRVTSAISAYSISLGGTHGYIITPEGAKKMLDYIQLYGMINAIDTMMQNASDYLRLWYSEIVVHAECIDHNDNVDSDIQRDYTSLRRDLQVRILDEMRYCMNIGIPIEVCKSGVCDADGKKAIIYLGDDHVSHDGYWEDTIDDAYLLIPESLHPKWATSYRLLKDGKYDISELIA
jgi:GR25 family glycosyltransferase involved in LPS biosynthesis